MIKNDTQMRRVLERIHEIEQDIKDLRERYSESQFEFWAGPSIDELEKLRSEIEAYQSIRTLTLEEALSGPLQKPTELESIADLLSGLRIASRRTQEEMAALLGWHQSNLSRFESENYGSQTIGKISEYVGALGVKLYVVASMDLPRLTRQYARGRGIVELKSFDSAWTVDTDTSDSFFGMSQQFAVDTVLPLHATERVPEREHA